MAKMLRETKTECVYGCCDDFGHKMTARIVRRYRRRVEKQAIRRFVTDEMDNR